MSLHRQPPGGPCVATGRMYGPADAAARLLVHDYLLVLRGAERTFAAMTDAWPDAPIVTLLYDEAGTEGRFAGRSVTTSPLQRLPLARATSARCCRSFPTATRRLDLSGFDCVVSSSSAFAHGVRPAAGARHVCYCHSPFRYAWHEQARALGEVPAPLRPALALLLRRHRAFDRRGRAPASTATSPTARSPASASGASGAATRRSSTRPSTSTASRSASPASTCCSSASWCATSGRRWRSRRPLRPGGGSRSSAPGRSWSACARATAHRPSSSAASGDERLAELYAEAAALVVPNVEEFGIAAVEAQAAGRPVVARRRRAARARPSCRAAPGCWSRTATRAALARALREDLTRFDPHDIRATPSASRARRSRPACARSSPRPA